ncbi:helix-turn-helix domain-containing protein [Tenacibaculum sp. E3R01]|uniref:helix-turn-helix domain-containing protein n=1 Tax=Tenacibaculum sp. E3R01 TaxID=2267227 RepID=UPI001F4654D1|nr:AraC family transcriptional regulator [Tenacibaculum sp. E3R01]
MSNFTIENVPDSYIKGTNNPDLYIYDLKMVDNAIKTKVNLNMHMFSFLQKGKKQVHFADSKVQVDNSQSILIKKGNCLWSELLDTDEVYYCKLLFFSEDKLKNFIKKHINKKVSTKNIAPYFVIENDDYLSTYLNSLNNITTSSSKFMIDLLSLKLEELLLYLLNKFGELFENYICSLVLKEESVFQSTIEKNIYSSLTIEEIAFLCNMSLSTFKRNFIKEHDISPGKWFRNKRLDKAKELLEKGNLKVSDIYLDLGYNNLSNFSSAFKTKFGISPSQIK